MSNSQLSLTISLIMIGLFTIAVIGFGVGFASDTNANISIADKDDVVQVYNYAQGNISSFSSESESTFQSIIDSTIEPGSDTLQSVGPVSANRESFIQSGKNAITLPINYIFGGLGSPFGIFFTAFFGIIALMFALYLIKTLRGNP